MILLDSSVWIDYLRAGDGDVAEILRRGQVLAHPWVTAEVALGSLRNREEVLRQLGQLPRATVAIEPEIAGLIAAESLWGRGIGLVDAALLASARLTPDARLWTRDRPLREVAVDLGCDEGRD